MDKVSLERVASTVASMSVEAARRRTQKRKKRAKPAKRKPRVETTSAPVEEADMTAPVTEYSCQVELSLSADFEGTIDKQRLIRKLRTELSASIRAAMAIVARDFGMRSTGVDVRPVRVECAVNDQ